MDQETTTQNKTMIKDAKESKKYQIIDHESFDNMGISDAVLRGIYAYGFEKPSSIQSKAIAPMIQGYELLGQAQSGTGKTGTFTIGALEKIDFNSDYCQGIIVSPTRELAQQTKFVLDSIGKFVKGLRTALCIGGVRVSDNKDIGRAHIVIGTPGRIIHMVKAGYLHIDDLYDHLKILIFDEADQLMEDKFADQTKTIVSYTTQKTQICFFSATLTPSVVSSIRNTILNESAVYIHVDEDKLTLDGISQFYINTEREHWKYETLCDLYARLLLAQTIIFVNSRNRGDWLVKKLDGNDFPAKLIHGDLTQAERTEIMQEFRSSDIRVLVSTDLLGRGIDVQQVSIVINYDIPKDKQQYLHRIGRSGRYGRKGIAINFKTDNPEDERKIKDIEEYYGTQIDPMPENINDFI
jgi:translation initiation factor 4A